MKTSLLTNGGRKQGDVNYAIYLLCLNKTLSITAFSVPTYISQPPQDCQRED